MADDVRSLTAKLEEKLPSHTFNAVIGRMNNECSTAAEKEAFLRDSLEYRERCEELDRKTG